MPVQRVLVVEDDSATALVCSLQKAGYNTTIASDAGQAVAHPIAISRRSS